MTSFLDFSNYLSNHSESLAVEVVDAVLNRMELKIPDWERVQAIRMYEDLLGFFGHSLTNGDGEGVPESLIEWSKKNSEMQLSTRGDIQEIVVRYPPTREVFVDILTRISVELGLSVVENAHILKRINQMLDTSLNETFFSFQRLSETYKEETQRELLELSAPLVPIKDEMVIMPLVGDIDEDIVNHIMDNVVPKIAELKVKYVITDFSGVLTINAQIADYFHQIGSTLRLMGVHVVMTGLRPKLVQTIIYSGIDISSIDSYATVKQAIENI